jgi:hypothetical protein
VGSLTRTNRTTPDMSGCPYPGQTGHTPLGVSGCPGARGDEAGAEYVVRFRDPAKRPARWRIVGRAATLRAAMDLVTGPGDWWICTRGTDAEPDV